jgi:hypothetical protein
MVVRESDHFVRGSDHFVRGSDIIAQLYLSLLRTMPVEQVIEKCPSN